MLLGGNVTRTIAGSIANVRTFAATPAVFMFGARVGLCCAALNGRQLAGCCAPADAPAHKHARSPTCPHASSLHRPLRPPLRPPGMLAAETGAMVWLLLATYMELPVSTTHSIIGGIIGFSLVYGGGSAVNWCALVCVQRG